jgi:SHS2 domain-containing protein
VPYRWGEHVGELELEVQADDEAGVFAEAVRALGELLGGEGAPHGDPERFELAAEAGDRAGLWAAWLEEVNYLAESEGVVPVCAERIVLESGRVRGRLLGHRGDPPHLVKAVTYHRLAFEPQADGWRARAVLDV